MPVQALVIVDAQRAFVSGIDAVPASGTLVPALDELLQRARAARALVVHLQNDGPIGDSTSLIRMVGNCSTRQRSPTLRSSSASPRTTVSTEHHWPTSSLTTRSSGSRSAASCQKCVSAQPHVPRSSEGSRWSCPTTVTRPTPSRQHPISAAKSRPRWSRVSPNGRLGTKSRSSREPPMSTSPTLPGSKCCNLRSCPGYCGVIPCARRDTNRQVGAANGGAGSVRCASPLHSVRSRQPRSTPACGGTVSLWSPPHGGADGVVLAARMRCRAIRCSIACSRRLRPTPTPPCRTSPCSPTESAAAASR